MLSAGQLLRTERQKQNRSLADLASQTRISERYLHAIESDNPGSLPGDFFYRSFLRQYALALDLDTQTMAQIVSSAVPAAEERDPLPALTRAYQEAEASRTSRWSPTTTVAAVVLLFVLAGGAGLYAWWQNLQLRSESMRERAASPPSAAQASAPGRHEPAPVPSLRSSEAVTAAASSPATTSESASFTVEISAADAVWVSLTSGGKSLYTGTMQPAETRRFELREDGKLTTGNAGALTVVKNGTSLGPVGPAGQIRTVLLRRDSDKSPEP